MTDSDKLALTLSALEKIREATFAEFQVEARHRPQGGYDFCPTRDICPYCRRASTAGHLHDKWALIQSICAETLRAVESPI